MKPCKDVLLTIMEHSGCKW